MTPTIDKSGIKFPRSIPNALIAMVRGGSITAIIPALRHTFVTVNLNRLEWNGTTKARRLFNLA